MLKLKRKFFDYNGNEREEEFYFNLNQSDIIKMEIRTEGGLQEYLNRIVAAQNGKEIVDTFENILKAAYGRPSLDGRRFEKSDELWKEFAETTAYDSLFVEMTTDADKAAKIINGMLPDPEHPDKVRVITLE